MKYSILTIALASWTISLGIVNAIRDNSQNFEGIMRPHSIVLNAAKLEKRNSAPAFEMLQDEWSAKVAQSAYKSVQKSTSNSDSCRKDVHTIESASDLVQLHQRCKTVIGSVHIVEYTDPIMDFGNIQAIQGDLIIENLPELVIVQANYLADIGGSFKLDGLTSLTSLLFPKLYHFEAIDWRVVPTLTTVNFAPNITSAKRITISDTSLINIEGFQNIEELEILNINNNRFMEHVKSNVKNVREQLSISANSKELLVELPQLKWANNITIRDANSASLPKLEYVNHSLEMIENSFESLEIPTIKSIGGTLGILENPNLEQVDFANVTKIQGGLMIANNSRIRSINFLPQLREIGGAIQFLGAFQEISLPQLRLVRGSALIKSSSDSLDCTKWTTPKSGSSIIRGGRITCNSGKMQNTVRVSEDGTLLGHEQRDTNNFSNKEANTGSSLIDRTKLASFGWALAFGWAVALICLATSQ